MLQENDFPGIRSDRIPQHVAIILDGNRRYSKQNALSLALGYKKAAKNAIEISEMAHKMGVKELSLWVFSLENFSRKEEERTTVFSLIETFLSKKMMRYIFDNDIEFCAQGKLSLLPVSLRETLQKRMDETKNGNGGRMNLCVSYSGKEEILDGIRSFMADGNAIEDVSEEVLSQYMYDFKFSPDMIIRTSGEKRTSGFLMWHAPYTEWIFEEKVFPEYTKVDFLNSMRDYQSRERRFGK